MQAVETKQDVAQVAQLEQQAEKNVPAMKEKPVYDFCKRIFDIVMSALALIVLSPVFLIVAIAIKREDGGNVFYSSIRLTKGGREFNMYKFRSMCLNADQMLDSLMDQNEVNGPAFKIKEDPRVTKVGRFIRATRLDELPQILAAAAPGGCPVYALPDAPVGCEDGSFLLP